MAIVETEKPEIITIIYNQEKTDPDYGTCLWARFNFDVQNYTLAIESDCGNFMYGWVRTPETESFLHLMARCEGDYILDKIASRSVIDEDSTYQSIVEYLSFCGECSDECLSFSEKLRTACGNYSDDRGVAAEIMDVCNAYGTEYDEYEIWRCIEHDYPAGAKKIAEIFDQHIRPAVRSMEA